MNSQMLISTGAAVLMFGLFMEALLFRIIRDDPPSMYKLFAVRDQLVRLIVEGKIGRNEPHFAALYTNVTLVLRASRRISGPDGWPLAEVQGRMLAHRPDLSRKLEQLPEGPVPDVLIPVVTELRAALHHLLANHIGVVMQIDARRRELARLQRRRARALLEMMPEYGKHTP